MRQISKLVIFLIITIAFTSCARVEAPKLPANYFYKGSYMDIHSPNQEGWSQISKDQTQIIFAKYGKKYNESYIARVVFYPMKKTHNNQDFLELIKERMIKSSNKKRFNLLKSHIKLSELRKYTCVLGSALYEDKFATTRKGNKEKLFMQVKSLYCKDPKRKDNESGFMIGYSHRGEKLNSTFDIEADSFIRGVEFSEYK